MSNQVTEIISAIREAATERPDHTYVRQPGHGCQYVDRNGEIHPGCLVGHGLWRTGLIGPSFINAAANKRGIELLMNDLGIAPTVAQTTWLVRVQDHQDIGYQWSMAVRRADGEFLNTPESRREELAMPVVLS